MHVLTFRYYKGGDRVCGRREADALREDGPLHHDFMRSLGSRLETRLNCLPALFLYGLLSLSQVHVISFLMMDIQLLHLDADVH